MELHLSGLALSLILARLSLPAIAAGAAKASAALREATQRVYHAPSMLSGIEVLVMPGVNTK